jgi:hypothetical protein
VGYNYSVDAVGRNVMIYVSASVLWYARNHYTCSHSRLKSVVIYLLIIATIHLETIEAGSQ